MNVNKLRIIGDHLLCPSYLCFAGRGAQLYTLIFYIVILDSQIYFCKRQCRWARIDSLKSVQEFQFVLNKSMSMSNLSFKALVQVQEQSIGQHFFRYPSRTMDTPTLSHVHRHLAFTTHLFFQVVLLCNETGFYADCRRGNITELVQMIGSGCRHQVSPSLTPLNDQQPCTMQSTQPQNRRQGML